ncbi:MAG: SMC-Scp complex subunit ScpB [Planctomycetia bacterium]
MRAPYFPRPRFELARAWSPPPGLETRRFAGRTRRRSARRRRSPASAEPTGPGPHHRSDELARLEAALFLAREPLSTRRLAKLAQLPDATRARTLIRELKRLQDESGSAFRIEQIAGGFRLLTRAALGPWVRRLLGTPAENRLSGAALETLAIVAYRQPVTRAEIEAIRGVGCEDMLRQLMERDFVAIGGRTEDLGRPNVYVTSRRFLQAFGLARIEDLPRIEPVDLPRIEPGDGGGPDAAPPADAGDPGGHPDG